MIWLFVACNYTPEELCAGKGPTSLELGGGESEGFEAFQPGDDAEIMVPPQGGYGLRLRARTLGLVTNNVLDLEMETEVDGELIGEFTAEEIFVYCQDDGSGLLWGTATPIDEAIFPSEEDLVVLDGAEAIMRVTATDVQGDSASSEATVTMWLRD